MTMEDVLDIARKDSIQTAGKTYRKGSKKTETNSVSKKNGGFRILSDIPYP
jgi:hypothetical protein